ncbi:MAG: universal stress protein [Thermoleophilia bacterium]|nr:universal stress protein [Thermoleophilia bacterium]
MGVIVVGVDHSEGAKAALRFALEEATLRGSKLRAVHAWQFSIPVPGIEGIYPALGAGLSDLHRAAEEALDAELRGTIPEAGEVEIERRVVEGAPGAVLVEESRGADLLVVGSRGHGGFAGLLLGSVSQQCAHHAACPVVIVPHEPDVQ